MKEDINEKKQFEKYLHRTMKQIGWIIPETIEDVFIIEREIEKTTLDMPRQLTDPNIIFNKYKQGKLNYKDNKIHKDDIDYPYTQAARNGSEIPEDIKEKMRIDRLEIEKNKNE